MVVRPSVCVEERSSHLADILGISYLRCIDNRVLFTLRGLVDWTQTVFLQGDLLTSGISPLNLWLWFGDIN